MVSKSHRGSDFAWVECAGWAWSYASALRTRARCLPRPWTHFPGRLAWSSQALRAPLNHDSSDHLHHSLLGGASIPSFLRMVLSPTPPLKTKTSACTWTFIFHFPHFSGIALLAEALKSFHTGLFFFFFFKVIFYWRIVVLQCCISFCRTVKWISCTCTYIPSFLDFLPI